MKQKSSKIDMSYSANLVNFKGRITVKIFSVNKITLIRFIWLFKFSLTKINFCDFLNENFNT